VLDSVDVHVPIAAPPPRLEGATDGKGGGDGKKVGREAREEERRRADAERAKEREKASIAAVRAQLAAKGCASASTLLCAGLRVQLRALLGVCASCI
jgi:hypothetical protein